MKIIKTKFSDLKIIKLKKNSDFRGNLIETYRKKLLKGKNFILTTKFFQEKMCLEDFIFITIINK